METGKFLEKNQHKLDALSDLDSEWKKALHLCKEHVKTRLKKRTVFGAHTDERLGSDPIEHYVCLAYEAILEGYWEWKESRSLAQQMIIIADNKIGKSVEKFENEQNRKFAVDHDNLDERFYTEDKPPSELTIVQEVVFAKQISIIEEAIKADVELSIFWECVKEGMKRSDIVALMDKTPKQIDKLRVKLIDKVKKSPHFQYL